MGLLPQILANTLITASLYAIFTIGFNLLLGAVKFFNIAFGGAILAGGYGFFLLYKILNFPLAVAFAGGILLSSLFCMLSYHLIFAPLRARKSKNFVLLIASFGLLIVAQSLVAIFFSSSFQPLAKNLETLTYTLGGARFNIIQLVTFLVALTLSIITFATLKWSRFGKAVRAIKDDEEVAELSGINTKKIIGALFFVSGIFAGVGIILFGLDTGVDPSLGLTFILGIVAAVIVGGMGSITGGILGAVIIAFFQNLAIWQFSGDWRDVVVFSILIIVLIFRPQGLMGERAI